MRAPIGFESFILDHIIYTHGLNHNLLDHHNNHHRILFDSPTSLQFFWSKIPLQVQGWSIRGVVRYYIFSYQNPSLHLLIFNAIFFTKHLEYKLI